MTPRQRRMTLVAGIVAGVAIAGTLALNAFRSNVTFFFDPTQVSQGEVKAGEHFRLGGMVTQGSVKRMPGSLEVRFVVTDFKHDVPVSYTGVLPDLFREGTGVVAHGKMGPNGTFVADEVLAKHDEKYMPPEVAKSLKRRHGEAREDALGEPTAPSAGAGPGSGQNGGASSPQSPSTTGTQGPPSLGGPAIQAAPTSREAPIALANSAPRNEPPPTPRTALNRTGSPPPPGGL
jgi:cytochrome c-type biogenesis protein CcmE